MPDPKKPVKVKKPRVKREPSELSIAVKSVGLLKRKQASREKLVAKIEALDAQIVELQNTAADNFKIVSDLIYGPDTATTAPAGA